MLRTYSINLILIYNKTGHPVYMCAIGVFFFHLFSHQRYIESFVGLRRIRWNYPKSPFPFVMNNKAFLLPFFVTIFTFGNRISANPIRTFRLFFTNTLSVAVSVISELLYFARFVYCVVQNRALKNCFLKTGIKFYA